LREATRSLAELSEEFHSLEARRSSLPAEERRYRWNETVLARSRALLSSILHRRSITDHFGRPTTPNVHMAEDVEI
jgi:hypothetical protein